MRIFCLSAVVHLNSCETFFNFVLWPANVYLDFYMLASLLLINKGRWYICKISAKSMSHLLFLVLFLFCIMVISMEIQLFMH